MERIASQTMSSPKKLMGLLSAVLLLAAMGFVLAPTAINALEKSKVTNVIMGSEAIENSINGSSESSQFIIEMNPKIIDVTEEAQSPALEVTIPEGMPSNRRFFTTEMNPEIIDVTEEAQSPALEVTTPEGMPNSRGFFTTEMNPEIIDVTEEPIIQHSDIDNSVTISRELEAQSLAFEATSEGMPYSIEFFVFHT